MSVQKTYQLAMVKQTMRLHFPSSTCMSNAVPRVHRCPSMQRHKPTYLCIYERQGKLAERLRIISPFMAAASSRGESTLTINCKHIGRTQAS